ncbi:MAG: type I-E CRISPR-associated protein Cas7/Cse4/CasC [Ignavibacteriaceae bacterium]|nr:type I-E CRISPR-associated protein Cas7/Cse4/CasC [Ignavibacteriaceae bacterium]
MIIELHLLQNVAPSCLNRDDANAPKDCEFGGYRRARISSQCIKRSVREEFKNTLPARTGVRTKKAASHLAELLTPVFQERSLEEITRLAITITQAYFVKKEKDDKKSKKGKDDVIMNEVNSESVDEQGESDSKAENNSGVAKKDKKKELSEISDVLYFYDLTEFESIVEEVANKREVFLEILNESDKVKGKKKNDNQEWKKIIQKIKPKPNALDIALFGRMMASFPDKNVDGSCQVAHAISTNRASMEFDFYTAVDDLQKNDESGAGMMGTVGFNSSCFYRYSVIHLDRLKENLKNNMDAVKEAVNAYIQASFTAMPTGKQNSFAAHNLPSFAFVAIRESNTPWSLANAFEKPVKPTQQKGLVANSVKELNSHWASLNSIYNSRLGLKAGYMFALPTPDLDESDYSALSGYKTESLDTLLSGIDSALSN